LLSIGRLGDLRGHKVIYVAGFVVFVAGSVCCGLSPAPIYLILSRALQAVGAAMLAAMSPAILTDNFPTTERGRALGAQGAMTYLGLTTGPFLGGWLTDRFGWHSVFFINLPIGLLALVLSLWMIPNDKPMAGKERFDLAGAGSFAVGLAALLFALDQGHVLGWLSPAILVTLTGAVATLSVFVWLEAKVRAPMLDLDLFRRRVFAVATASPILNYVCVFSVLFLMPFYLIQGRGYAASQAGLVLTAQPIVMALVAPWSGSLSDRVGSRWPTTIGMLVFALGLWILSTLGPSSPIGIAAGGLAVCGLGTGMFVSPNNSALMGDAPRAKHGIAAGVLALARNVGMALGIGLTGAVFNSYLGGTDTVNPLAVVGAFAVSMRFVAAIAAAAALVTFARGDDRPAVAESH
jgi:EmrB/QacA subfamily drug resistance transporter